jgi:putative Mg2+ transporter-C (MgtC) family protein
MRMCNRLRDKRIDLQIGTCDGLAKSMNLATPSIDLAEIGMRLGFATGAGAILGLNRWMHHKAAGVRTHSLVSIGGAMVVMLVAGVAGADAQAVSRVLQGLITGIGFLGAGVIIRQDHSNSIHGLTTAASLWACGILGATFGSGQYALGTCAMAAVFLVLVLGGPLERLAARWSVGAQGSEQAKSPQDPP